MQTAKASLKFQQGGSDKVYLLNLEQCETGWSVYAAWGRRNSTLQTGNKIKLVPYDDAKEVYDRILKEKLGKGYQHSESLRTATDHEGDSRKPSASIGLTVGRSVSKAIVFAPELLTRITERELLAFVRSPRHWFQWKRDGVRLTVVVETGDVYGYNKLGQVVQVDSRLATALRQLCVTYRLDTLMLDGEWEASGYWAWDCLQVNEMDMRGIEYRIRFETLEEYLTDLPAASAKLLHLTQTAKTSDDKAAMMQVTKEMRIEGICAKLITASHRVGRAGQHYKCKYEATASFIVGPKPKHKANDGHRSVALYVLDKGRERFVATVKVADKYEVPPNGSIAEVRYLYAHPNGGIVQPCFFGVLRKDVKRNECLAEALKYKAEAEDEAA